MFVWQTVTSFLILISALICSYYCFLAFVALFASGKKTPPATGCPAETLRIAIVIPAHDEENVIGHTLQSCLNLDYPKDLFRIFVVADNCSDATAEVAGKYGATVIERRDAEHRGKGFALSHAFEHVLPQGYEAVVIIDADCLIDRDALRVIAQNMADGAKVLQINNTVSNPDQSVMSYALAVGNFIENMFFYAPKSLLGFSVFLRGTGMVLHRDVLLAHPWSAHSIVEDVEYSLTLLQAGYRIRFVPQVKVASPFPTEQDQLRVQRTRWASGNLTFGRKAALGLIAAGVRQGKWVVADAGWTFLVLSRPLVLLLLFMALGAAIVSRVLWPDAFSVANLACAVIVTFLFVLYFLSGIVRMGLSFKRICFLAHVPVTVFHLIVISLLGVFGFKKETWARTPR